MMPRADRYFYSASLAAHSPLPAEGIPTEVCPELEKPTDPIETGEGDDEADGLPPIEKKYQKQMRQLVSQKLDLPVSTLPAMLKEQIKLNPEFQRRDRWDEYRQSRLIESLVMNVPIPPVFLGEDEYGQYVVLDGRQRFRSSSAITSS
jgi:hypothetical protein